MTQKQQKILTLPSKPKVSLCSLKNFRFLILETSFLTKKYFKLTSVLNVKKEKNLLLVNSMNTKSEPFFLPSLGVFTSWLKKFAKPFRKQLFLKGLGFKANLSVDGLFLELKLGFSHIIKISTQLPELKLLINNTSLSVEGFEAYKVGNFLKKVRNLKAPDIYKGKGFWYKNEIKVFKEIKKT
jgi:ribosomal protein L6P/L9E